MQIDGVFVDEILLYLSSEGWNMDSIETAGPRHGVKAPQELPGKLGDDSNGHKNIFR
jgi:hypothetical protein